MRLLPLILCSFITAAMAVEHPWPKQPVLMHQAELYQIVAADAKLELLAEGFRWAEGPVVEPQSGAVLFSDVPANTVYRWQEQQGLSVYLRPSGYTGLYPEDDPEQNLQEGANGLIFNADKQLVLAQHGDRRLALLLDDTGESPSYQTLANQYQGKLLNSPNDLVQHSSGAYYFTDPPYGLKGGDLAAQKQLPVNGVYLLRADGSLTLLVTELTRPNGLAFSPDEKWLYVANSDPDAAQWWRYPVNADGSLGVGALFFDATEAGKTLRGLPDGLKVLPDGDILATGPGGVWVFTPDAQHLGTIQTGVAAANVALSPDLQFLYITATHYLLRIKLVR